jgi:hypothetical protein
MFQSNSPKVQEIVRIVQMHGCTVDGEAITLSPLQKLYKQLNEIERKEIDSLILSLENELEEQIADRDYAIREIESLDPDKLDELEENRSDLEFAKQQIELTRPALKKLREVIK